MSSPKLKMETAESPASTASSTRKRSHDEIEESIEAHPPIVETEDAYLTIPTSPSKSVPSRGASRQTSPPASIQSSVLSDARSVTPTVFTAPAPFAADDIQNKKRKLTFAEKEVERALKASENDARQKQKAEETQKREQLKLEKTEAKRRREEEKEADQRAKDFEKAERQKAKEAKDAEKKAKDEEKRVKEAERKASREAEKQAKNDAQRVKNEEKDKKARSQLKLGSFFQKPVATATLSRSPSRRSSIVSIGSVGIDDESSAKLSPQKKQDAKQAFLPFFVQNHVELAPRNRFLPDENLAHMAASRLDSWMTQDGSKQAILLRTTFKNRRRNRLRKTGCTMRQLVEHLHGTSAMPIDLTQESVPTQVSHVPYKILSYKEDVRPPYMGTYTRIVSPGSALKLSRCPWSRQLPETNYDYDSEAEWEPPNEDDEDIGSGDDVSDLGDDADEDMDGFLDDEEDLVKRKHIVNDMEPVSSGLCWLSSQAEKGPLEQYRMQPVSDEISLPINPFSDSYWPQPQAPKQASGTAAMQPPRLPLAILNPNRSPSSTTSTSLKNDQKPGDTIAQVIHTLGKTGIPTATGGKPLKLASADVLPAFKQAVEGSDLTKAGLVEVLKKQFPKLSKDTIKDTLGHVAVRQGVKEVDKKWVLTV